MIGHKIYNYDIISLAYFLLNHLGKSFTRSCLWRFGVKLRHSIRAMLGAPVSSSGSACEYSSGLEEAL